jgi:hypothetical protein
MPQPAEIAFNDQADAARAHLARILERTAPGLLGEYHRNTEITPWLLPHLGAFAVDLANGSVQLCEHLARATSPHPAFGILGTPRLACPACVRALTPAADLRCDRCGNPADEFEPALAEFGTIALVVLQCDTCARTP